VLFKRALLEAVGHCFVVPALVKGAVVVHDFVVANLRWEGHRHIVQIVRLVVVKEHSRIKHGNNNPQAFSIQALAF